MWDLENKVWSRGEVSGSGSADPTSVALLEAERSTVISPILPRSTLGVDGVKLRSLIVGGTVVMTCLPYSVCGSQGGLFA